MQPIHVRDPDEMPWAVGVPMLPWRPRWRGPGRREVTATSDTAVEAGARVGLEGGGELAGALFDEGPWGPMLVVVAVVAVPLVLFAAALALEIVLVVLLALLVLLARILLRRPFEVVAVAADGRRRSWRVRGLGAARAWAPEAAVAIEQGTDPQPPAT